jgi:hypothetical protein
MKGIKRGEFGVVRALAITVEMIVYLPLLLYN